MARGCSEALRGTRFACTCRDFGRFEVGTRTPSELGATGRPDGIGERRVTGGLRLCGERDEVGEGAHGVEVAGRREALEPQRVEAVARQQREVVVLARQRRGSP